jgi:hypothetical protein
MRHAPCSVCAMQIQNAVSSPTRCVTVGGAGRDRLWWCSDAGHPATKRLPVLRLRPVSRYMAGATAHYKCGPLTPTSAGHSATAPKCRGRCTYIQSCSANAVEARRVYLVQRLQRGSPGRADSASGTCRFEKLCAVSCTRHWWTANHTSSPFGEFNFMTCLVLSRPGPTPLDALRLSLPQLLPRFLSPDHPAQPSQPRQPAQPRPGPRFRGPNTGQRAVIIA